MLTTHLRDLGTIEVQLRTVPPYLASAVWVVINAYISQRLRLRFLPLLYNVLITVIGYIMSVTTHDSQARYAPLPPLSSRRTTSCLSHAHDRKT